MSAAREEVERKLAGDPLGAQLVKSLTERLAEATTAKEREKLRAFELAREVVEVRAAKERAER